MLSPWLYAGLTINGQVPFVVGHMSHVYLFFSGSLRLLCDVDILSGSERNATGLFSQISAFIWVLEGDKINKVLTLKYNLWCVVS